MKFRVFIAEDNIFIREGLKRLLNDKQDCLVCGEADTFQNALIGVEATKPDLVIVDLFFNNAEQTGINLVRELKFKNNDLPILVLSINGLSTAIDRVVDSGAKQYLINGYSRKNFLEAIDQTLEKGFHSDKKIIKNHQFN